MSNHTHAPWTRKDTVCYDSFYGKPCGMEHWVLGPNGEELACPDLAEDADLISATPELLEACEHLVSAQRVFETNAQEPGRMPGNDHYSDIFMGIVRAAQEAIAKAKGDNT